MIIQNVELIQKSGYKVMKISDNVRLEDLAKLMVDEAKAQNCAISADYKGFELISFPDNTPEYLIGFYRGYSHRNHGNFKSMRYKHSRG